MGHSNIPLTGTQLSGRNDAGGVRIVGDSEMARHVRTFDWAATPLGAMETWSETLLSYVNLLLCSPLPATLSWGEELTFLYNDAAIPTLGERHPHALGHSYRTVFADAWHLVGQDMEDCFLRGGTPVRRNVNVPLLRNGVVDDGYYTYGLIPVYEAGKIVGVYDPYQDTTETVLSERERVRQEERLELALSAANGVGVWDWDVSADRVFTDASFAELYGLDPEDRGRGVPMSRFTANIHGDDLDRVSREVNTVLRTGADFACEYRLVKNDGTVRWAFAKGRCYRDAQGLPSRFLGVSIDVTERVEMERALRKSAAKLQENEARFRTFVEAVSDVVYRVSGDWSVALEVEGRGFVADTHTADPHWFERNVHPDDHARVRQVIQEAMRDGKIFELEHKVQRLDGATGWTFSRAIPVRNTDGVITEWFGAASDITARKQAEQALLSTEKLAVVGRLASSIAHEINNPLEAITNLLYLAEQGADPETKGYLLTAQEELRRVSHIATNTLQFNRQKLVPGPVDVVTTMQSVINLYQGRMKQAGVTITFRHDDCPTLNALAGELRQVFANLLGNAIDAMRRGGTLKIHIGPARLWRTGDSGVRITVADNGSGMSPETRAQVFKPFFTTKEETGTGLGLWVSADIVRRHHGVIQLRSSVEPGCSGTTFSLLFPRSGAEGVPDERSRASLL
jgi:PAS domain S-box-containing protein